MQAVNGSSQGVASDPILFTKPTAAQETAPAAEPFSLPVNEEAMAATGDGSTARATGNRLPALT